MSDQTRATDESPITIGGAARPKGRRVPGLPRTVLDSGYEVEVRRLAAGVTAQLQAQAHKELAEARPAVPTQRVETAPGQWSEVPNPHDPDYERSLKAYHAQAQQLSGAKLLQLLQDYAIVTPTDAAAVADYRAAMAAIGLEVPDDDRAVFCWQILAPTQADQQRLIGFVLGLSEAQQEAVAAQQATFRGDLPGAAPGALPDAGGQGAHERALPLA